MNRSSTSQSNVQKPSYKREASPHYNIEDNRKKVKGNDDKQSKTFQSNVNEATQDTYHKGGLAHSLHGNIYQLKLQMLFLKRAIDKEYEFSLGTEVEDAEKFDDIVFKYRQKNTSGKYEICFVQVKHKQDESRKITSNDLLNAEDDDFSLQKYFISYRKIKENSAFKGYVLKELIIFTNIDFADLGNSTMKITKREHNDILNVTKLGEPTKYCQFLLNADNNKQIYEHLKATSDLHVLVQTLKRYIIDKKKLRLVGIIKNYHNALSKHIFNIKSKEIANNKGNTVTQRLAKFRDDFVKGKNLSVEVSNLRNLLKTELEFHGKDLTHVELEVSGSFGEEFAIQSKTIANIANQFADMVFRAQSDQSKIITCDINKLAYCVLEDDEEHENLKRFKNTFFNNDNKKESELENFRAALKVELNNRNVNFEELSQYKFALKKNYTCEQEAPEKELSYTKFDIPSDKIEDAEIDEFLEKLVFAVNQPNEEELGDIITEEIGESNEFNLLDANLVSDSFQKKMLDWFKEKHSEKGKEGVWLNAERGKKLFDSIKSKICGLISVGISVAYPGKLANYGITLNEISIFNDLKDFLSRENFSKKICHIIAPEESILCAIKVYSALEKMKQLEQFKQYKKNDSYIFIRSSILLGNKTSDYIIDAFKSKGNHNLLVIHWESTVSEYEIRTLCRKLYNIVLNEPSKKIIVIAKEHNNLTNKFKEDWKLSVTDNYSFGDLDNHSQEKLLQKEIIFQGNKVRLEDLIAKSDKNIIDLETLVKLMKGDKISIGSKVIGMGEVDYIARRVHKITLSMEKLQEYFDTRNNSDFFVIDGTGHDLKHKNIYIFDRTESAERKFNELCNQKSKSNIHWLKYKSKKITWRKSFGSIVNLKQYRIRENYPETDTRPIETNNMKTIVPVEHNKLFHQIEDHKIVIISNTAGMGKSTELAHLAMELKEKSSTLWVITISLNDHTSLLNEVLSRRKKNSFDQNVNEEAEFLLHNLLESQMQSNLEKKMFEQHFNKYGNIALLFDGFDEISPYYKDVVIDLLQTLKASNVKKMFITTRPNLSEVLESALEVFSHALVPFTKENQIEFLVTFWTKNLYQQDFDEINRKKLTTYAESVIEYITKQIDDESQNFIGIPLQTQMLAEVFQENQKGTSSTWNGCKEFLKSDLKKPELPKECTLLDLYERFVEKKFQIYLEKKCTDSTKPGEIESKDKAYKKYKKMHAILAMQTLFSEKIFKQLLPQTKIEKLESLIGNIKEYKQNKGIIDQIIDNKPHFLHRTFAEYFASFTIAKKIITNPAETLKYIDDMLLNMSAIFILSIIEQLSGKQAIITEALKQPLLHFVVVNNHSHFIKSILKLDFNDWPKKLDTYGKTPLHYAIEHGHSNMIYKILDYANDIHQTDILKHGEFKNTEYEFSKLVNFINIQDIEGNTALNYAMQQNYIDIAFELLYRGASLDSLTEIDVIILMNKMLDLHGNGILGVYANQESKYRCIQEKLFLKAPGIFNELCEKDQSRILSYFFVHGRVNVIDALLGTINDLEKRIAILNNPDNHITPLDRVNDSDQLSDDERLQITKYLSERGGTKSSKYPYQDQNVYDYGCPYNYITSILQAAAKQGSMKTFKYFIAQEKENYYYLHFYEACRTNQLNIIKYLIENHKDKISTNGNTPLHTACDSGAHLEIINYVLDNSNINVTNDRGETPIFMAIFKQRLEVVEYLITKGCDFNWEDNNGYTPLSLAVENNEEMIINCLLKKNARISDRISNLIKHKVAILKNASDNTLNLGDGNKSLRIHSAIKNRNTEIAKFLIRYGDDINEVDSDGNSPLHLASARKDVETAELLLLYGAIYDKKNFNDKTPYDLCHSDKIRWLLLVLFKLFNSQSLMADLNMFLLKKGTNDSLKDWGPYGRGHPDAWDSDNPMLFILNARNVRKKTLIHIAAADSDGVEVMDILSVFNHDYLQFRKKRRLRYLDYQSISINTIDAEGNTPLHLAAQKGHGENISWLLKEGAIFESKNYQGETPELLAIKNKHTNVVVMLQPTKNIFIALKEVNKNTILDINNCIKNKAYINAKNESGKTLLHIAAASGQHDVVQLLLDKGADSTAIDENNNTPLHIAAENDYIKIVILLLNPSYPSQLFIKKTEAIYDAINTQDQTPLDLAHGESLTVLECIDKLFKHIQSDNPKVVINDFEIMQNKFASNICTNARDNKGNTLLHYAVISSKLNFVELLLENGAFFNARNNLDYTPSYFATDRNIETLLNDVGNMFDNFSNIYQAQNKVSIKIITHVCDGETGKSLLYHAAKSCEWKAVEFLVKNGANVNLLDIHYPKNGSSRDDDPTIVKYLIDNGDVNATNYLHETPLLMAINARCELSIIEYLVDKGADVNCQDLFSNTPLSCAVDNKDSDVIKYLLKKGAHIPAKISQLLKDSKIL